MTFLQGYGSISLEMKREKKDFPEIGIIERYFRWKNSMNGNFLKPTRSSPEITFFPENIFRVTYLLRNSGIPKGKRASLASVNSLPDTPEKALSEAFSCINSWFSNPVEFSSWEELDLFLSSEGF